MSILWHFHEKNDKKPFLAFISMSQWFWILTLSRLVQFFFSLIRYHASVLWLAKLSAFFFVLKRFISFNRSKTLYKIKVSCPSLLKLHLNHNAQEKQITCWFITLKSHVQKFLVQNFRILVQVPNPNSLIHNSKVRVQSIRLKVPSNPKPSLGQFNISNGFFHSLNLFSKLDFQKAVSNSFF